MEIIRKVIIDYDPGIDGTLVLSLAVKFPDIEVVAITVICGNVPADIGVQNVLKCLECCDHLDISVYQGMEESLKQPLISTQDTHRLDGLGDTNFPMVLTEQAELLHAVDFLADCFKEKTGTPVIALGLLTNIASALKNGPSVGKHTNHFVSMGRTYKNHGNCLLVAEHGYWCDPETASYVLEELRQPIEMVGLDVTGETVLTPTIPEYCCQMNPKEGEYLKTITRLYSDFHREQGRISRCVINDPLAVTYFIDESIYESFKSFAAVETEGLSHGQTLVDHYKFRQGPANSEIMTKVGTRLFFQKLLAAFLNTQEETIIKGLERLKMGWQNE